MSQQPLRYIVVEGPIGVGKTSLAKRLSEQFDASLLLEDADENPFLQRFYQNPREAALPTQLHFLMQRTRQIQALRQQDIFTRVCVADFLMEKDYLFAGLTLDTSEFDLYQQVYSYMTIDAPKPDLVVYLQAPVHVLLQRINHRGRSFERLMDSAYLQRVNEAYAKFFYDYDTSPLLIVNASEIDFIGNERDYQDLLNQIAAIRGGRQYFNPLPFAV